VRQRYKYDSTGAGGGARALYAEYERSSVTDGSRDTFVIISIKHVKVCWEYIGNNAAHVCHVGFPM
jgi:hypothetical protein